MRIYRALCLAAVPLAAAAFPVPAFAQAAAQSQEGAVRFLGLFAAQERPPMTSSTRYDRLDVDSRLRKAVPVTRWVKVTPFDAKHPCRVDLEDSEGKPALIDWDETQVIYHTRANWSDAMLASDYGPLIKPVIEIRGKGSTSYVIWPASEDQGARVVRAMQFLVESCDPLKGTGF